MEEHIYFFASYAIEKGGEYIMTAYTSLRYLTNQVIINR